MINMPDKPPLEAVYLAHFGIKGMRWGFRKNTLTETRPHRSVVRPPVEKPESIRSAKIKRYAKIGAAATVGVLYVTGNLGRTVSATASGSAAVGRLVAEGVLTVTLGAASLVTNPILAIGKSI